MQEIAQSIDIFISKLAKTLAIFGAIILCSIAIMVLISIIGRALIPLGFSSIKGDFELVEAGTAFAIIAFMPYCQLHRAHAQVNFITDRLGVTANKIIDFIVNIIMFLFTGLLAWRLSIGTIEKFKDGETSFILQFPLWMAYGLSLIALYIWLLVALWILVFSFFSKDRNLGQGGGKSIEQS